ncbi:splicing coactivator [Teratosphaeria destructans]|uniref:Splicing coactivator n=1 Tax=Teratosphaeria destructans TaxID=418781 RepID=A0A9W7SJW6_9PEZI|nr:splicing coactivator [Teratosphaeria destructans]
MPLGQACGSEEFILMGTRDHPHKHGHKHATSFKSTSKLNLQSHHFRDIRNTTTFFTRVSACSTRTSTDAMSAKLVTDVDQRRLRTTKFPDEFSTKVDMRKVNIDVIKKWAKDEIEKILNAEDDVVVDLVNNLIEGERYPNIKQLQISLSGFLDKDAPRFCLELWKLCISAQANAAGIPKELLEAKKMELIQEKIKEEQVREAARKRQEEERERDRELARIRERDRDDRHRGRGGRGGRYDRDRSPPRRDSRSPPPRYRRDGDDFYRAPRATDSYVPARRGRSPSSSRSRSPPPRRKRRNSSSSRSRSPEPRRRRRADSRDRRNDRRRRSRSARRRRDDSRSPSPKRIRRASRSVSRSPPPRRKRRLSPSRSRSPQPYRKKKPSIDLMAVNGRPRRNEPRLSREPTSVESTPRDERPRRRNTSSVSSDRRSTSGGAADHVGID